MILPTLISYLNLTAFNADNLPTKVCTSLQQKLNNNNVNVNATPVYGASYNTFVGCELTANKSTLNTASKIIKNKVIVNLRSGYKITSSEFTVNNTLFVFVSAL